MSIQFRIHNKDSIRRKKSTAALAVGPVDPAVLLKLLLNEKTVFCGVDVEKKEPLCKISTHQISSHALKTLKFVGHFILVMSLLYLSAFIFSNLEESESGQSCVKRTNKSHEIVHNASSIGMVLNTEEYSDLTDCDVENLILLVERLKKRGKRNTNSEISDVHNNVQKWFYFVVIATTTIGYGDVYPKTQNGRIFYCCFSVVGIILMMSLLRSCGAILTALNKRFYRSVRHYLFRGVKGWSEELLSVVSMTFLFIVYLSLGIWHDSLDRSDNRSIVDVIYYWVVSFTTVGFGDIVHSVEFEIEHAYELTVYRVFGLSLVAAIIESLQSYIELRKEKLQVDALERQKKILEKIHSSMVSSPLLCKGGVTLDEEQYNIFNAIREMASTSFIELQVQENRP